MTQSDQAIKSISEKTLLYKTCDNLWTPIKLPHKKVLMKYLVLRNLIMKIEK